MNYHYLVEVFPKYFHLFPCRHTTQDINMKPFKRIGNCVGIRAVKQKDGSKFKFLYAKRSDQLDIIRRLNIDFPDTFNIWQETKVTKEWLEDWVFGGKVLYRDDHEYKVYWLHTFLNGKRMFPLIINKGAKTFYNACTLFEGLVPEDNLGVLVSDVDDLVLDGVWKPEEIDYRSFVRLCSHCGVVSNLARPKKNPWLLNKHM